MNFFAAIASLENRDGEKIFKVILNDALIFLVKLLIFLLVIYIGRLSRYFIVNGKFF